MWIIGWAGDILSLSNTMVDFTAYASDTVPGHPVGVHLRTWIISTSRDVELQYFYIIFHVVYAIALWRHSCGESKGFNSFPYSYSHMSTSLLITELNVQIQVRKSEISYLLDTNNSLTAVYERRITPPSTWDLYLGTGLWRTGSSTPPPSHSSSSIFATLVSLFLSIFVARLNMCSYLEENSFVSENSSCLTYTSIVSTTRGLRTLAGTTVPAWVRRCPRNCVGFLWCSFPRGQRPHHSPMVHMVNHLVHI